jgi:phage tail protein X
MKMVTAMQGDTVDLMCHRFYGRTAGVVEAVYESNPFLANHGPVLPHGTAVKLPDMPPPPQQKTIQLWD